MCIGCREVKPKNELVRVIKTPEGDILLDVTGKKNGRGAYLCANPACVNAAAKQRALSKALKCEIPDLIYAEIERELSERK